MRPPRLQPLFGAYAHNPVYLVTFCTKARRPLLNNAVAHAAFLSACERVEKAGNAVGRYVLMPDHAHLFIRLGWDGNLGAAVRCLKSGITRSLRRGGCSCVIWQDGFFDHLLRKSERYMEKWDYVRLNPVRAGLMTQAENWPYQGEFIALRW